MTEIGESAHALIPVEVADAAFEAEADAVFDAAGEGEAEVGGSGEPGRPALGEVDGLGVGDRRGRSAASGPRGPARGAPRGRGHGAPSRSRRLRSDRCISELTGPTLPGGSGARPAVRRCAGHATSPLHAPLLVVRRRRRDLPWRPRPRRLGFLVSEVCSSRRRSTASSPPGDLAGPMAHASRPRRGLRRARRSGVGTPRLPAPRPAPPRRCGRVRRAVRRSRALVVRRPPLAARVGDYTAAAVVAFAHHRRAIVLDTNVGASSPVSSTAASCRARR